jgi:hypothetical protein
MRLALRRGRRQHGSLSVSSHLFVYSKHLLHHRF